MEHFEAREIFRGLRRCGSPWMISTETTIADLLIGSGDCLGKARSRGRNVPQFGVELCRRRLSIVVGEFNGDGRKDLAATARGVSVAWVTAMERSRQLGTMNLGGGISYCYPVSARSKVQLSRSVNSMVMGSKISRLSTLPRQTLGAPGQWRWIISVGIRVPLGHPHPIDLSPWVSSTAMGFRISSSMQARQRPSIAG